MLLLILIVMIFFQLLLLLLLRGKSPLLQSPIWRGLCGVDLSSVYDKPKIFVCCSRWSSELTHKNKCVALALERLEQLDGATTDLGALDVFNAEVCVCHDFLSIGFYAPARPVHD